MVKQVASIIIPRMFVLVLELEYWSGEVVSQPYILKQDIAMPCGSKKRQCYAVMLDDGR